MRITIEYDSSWRNSFLSETKNEEDLQREFIATTKQLEKNFYQKEVSHNTVMGILNRLIGEQKKLAKARKRLDYFFKDLESQITFTDRNDRSYEIIYLRNLKKNSVDPKAFSGIVKASDLAFTSDYSLNLWGVLFLEIDEIFQLIVNNKTIDFSRFSKKIHPIDIKNRLASLSGSISIEGEIYELLQEFQRKINGFDCPESGQKINISNIYSLLIYWQLDELSKYYDISSVLSPQGKLTGIALSGIFTEKDFMARYSTGGNKKSWGSPYINPSKKNLEIQDKMLTKANHGILEINLNISKDQARDLEEKIENAGVSAFYLGKKGLAYVKDIR